MHWFGWSIERVCSEKWSGLKLKGADGIWLNAILRNFDFFSRKQSDQNFKKEEYWQQEQIGIRETIVLV